jgi:hypothetical protein
MESVSLHQRASLRALVTLVVADRAQTVTWPLQLPQWPRNKQQPACQGSFLPAALLLWDALLPPAAELLTPTPCVLRSAPCKTG